MSKVGLYGTITVDLCAMFLHSFFCVSVLGAFFIYIVLDIMLVADSSPTEDTWTDGSVMIWLSLPFLFIFLIGCHSMYLTNMIYDELSHRKKENQPLNQPLLLDLNLP